MKWQVYGIAFYKMTQGAAQHKGKQIGITAAPCFPSDDSWYRLFALYPYLANYLVLSLIEDLVAISSKILDHTVFCPQY